MATILPAPYDPGLGITIPDTILDAGLDERLQSACDTVLPLFHRLEADGNPGRFYLLTSAHRRRIVIKTNLRELYHMARLRLDGHAQWEIRRIVGQMCDLAAGQAPELTAYLVGKDAFDALKH